MGSNSHSDHRTIVRLLLNSSDSDSEYSSSVWDPYHANHINTVEMVQRRAARFCLGRYGKTDSVTEMINELHWESLADRRKAGRLSVFLRVYNDDECLADLSQKIVKAPMGRLRNYNPFRVQSINCRRDVGQYSFLPRSIRDWNKLTPEILNPNNMENSKSFRLSMLNGE